MRPPEETTRISLLTMREAMQISGGNVTEAANKDHFWSKLFFFLFATGTCVCLFQVFAYKKREDGVFDQLKTPPYDIETDGNMNRNFINESNHAFKDSAEFQKSSKKYSCGALLFGIGTFISGIKCLK